MKALTIIFGVILLLPGVCSLAFFAVTLPEMFLGRGGLGEALALMGPFWLVSAAISYGGYRLLRSAMRKA